MRRRRVCWWCHQPLVVIEPDPSDADLANVDTAWWLAHCRRQLGRPKPGDAELLAGPTPIHAERLWDEDQAS